MPPPAPPTSAMPPPVAPPATPAKKKRWPWVVGALVVLTVIGAAMGGGDKDAKDNAAPAEDAPAVVEDAPVAEETPVVEETPAEEPAADSGISQGFGSKDASADVSEVKIVLDDDEFMPMHEVSLRITNNSEKRSDYFIDVAVESADGSERIDEASIYVENLEPGQSTVETGLLMVEDLPADAVASVKTVQRTASN